MHKIFCSRGRATSTLMERREPPPSPRCRRASSNVASMRGIPSVRRPSLPPSPLRTAEQCVAGLRRGGGASSQSIHGLPLISVTQIGLGYNVWCPHSRDVLFCFLSKVLVTNWAAHWLQYLPKGCGTCQKCHKNIMTDGMPHSVDIFKEKQELLC